jgi:small subunit ribosomal protein S14
MAKKCLINKQKRKPKFKVRVYNRCRLCGRPPRFPSSIRHVPPLLPSAGERREGPGVTKASW